MAINERIVIRLINAPERTDRINLLIKYRLRDVDRDDIRNSMWPQLLEVNGFFEFLIFFEIDQPIFKIHQAAIKVTQRCWVMIG